MGRLAKILLFGVLPLLVIAVGYMVFSYFWIKSGQPGKSGQASVSATPVSSDYIPYRPSGAPGTPTPNPDILTNLTGKLVTGSSLKVNVHGDFCTRDLYLEVDKSISSSGYMHIWLSEGVAPTALDYLKEPKITVTGFYTSFQDDPAWCKEEARKATLGFKCFCDDGFWINKITK